MAPDLSTVTRVFGRIGLLSFGGPAAQIALMHETLVTRHKWLTEQDYLRALSLCMLLPGPEAMQLATYAGWRLRGVLGGLLAGLLFVVPGALLITALAFCYVQYGSVPFVQAVFLGLKACVIVIVVQALISLSRKALCKGSDRIIAGLAFLAIFGFGLPFPLIIVAAAVFGYFSIKKTQALSGPLARPKGTLRTVLTWALIWAAPLVLVWAMNADFLVQIGLFFSKLAVVTFGGAYAVLAYMTQEVVQDYGWLETGHMIDALGLAETTPGPLILVTQFVALLAGYAQGGLGLAITAGLLTLWVTFVPCFLWIFAAAPYVEHIAARPKLSAALHCVTAAVVGVIANLSLWFALHVIFDAVTYRGVLPIPVWSSMNLWACACVALAFALMHLANRSFLFTLSTLGLVTGGLGLAGFI